MDQITVSIEYNGIIVSAKVDAAKHKDWVDNAVADIAVRLLEVIKF